MSGKYDLDRDLAVRSLKLYVKDLESQLAEKDAEIQRLKDALSILQTISQVER